MDGHEVLTVEGLSSDGRLAPLQQAFLDLGGTQCGMCTPGMLLAAHALLASGRPAGVADIREAIAGNLCRCTGYTKIIEAIEAAAGDEAARSPWTAPAADAGWLDPAPSVPRDGPPGRTRASCGPGLAARMRSRAWPPSPTSARSPAAPTSWSSWPAGPDPPARPLLDLWDLDELRGIEVVHDELVLGRADDLGGAAPVRRSCTARCPCSRRSRRRSARSRSGTGARSAATA